MRRVFFSVGFSRTGLLLFSCFFRRRVHRGPQLARCPDGSRGLLCIRFNSRTPETIPEDDLPLALHGDVQLGYRYLRSNYCHRDYYVLLCQRDDRICFGCTCTLYHNQFPSVYCISGISAVFFRGISAYGACAAAYLCENSPQVASATSRGA